MKNLTKGNLTSTLFRIAIPVILQGLFLQVQILVDRAFLGQLNSQYFSAVGNVMFPYFATIEVLFAISIGATIVISHNIGAKKYDDARVYSEAVMKYNTILSLTLFVIWFFFSDFIFSLLGVQSPILEFSTRYVKFLSIYLITFGIEISVTSVLQGIGYTHPMLYMGLLRNAVNIFLGWLLIFGNWGVPRMDLEGAALATTLSNLIVIPIYLGIFFHSKKIPFKVRLINILKSQWKTYNKLIRIGLPAGLESFLWQIGSIIILMFTNALDTMAAGIYSLLFSIEIFPFWIYLGIAKANLTLIGQKTGAKEYHLINKISKKCMVYSLVISLVFTGAFLFFPLFILNIFTKDTSLISRALPFLMIISLNMVPRSINVVVGHGIRGLGDTKWMLYTQIFGTCFVVIVSFVLVFLLKMNLIGIFIAIVADEVIRSVINSIRFYKKERFPLPTIS
jgi:putative MATE family efflux protein